MAPLTSCEECQCEMVDCEHLSHARKIAQIKEHEPRRADEAKEKARIAQTQALSEWFRVNPERDDWLDAPGGCAFRAMDIMRIRDEIANPDGSDHGPRCICPKCFDPNGGLDDRYFFLVDGVGALVVSYREIPALLAQYPNAREVR